MRLKEDCFAYNNGKCRCLNVGHCQGFNACGFYKPQSQQDYELLKYNGTTNYIDIAKAYADRKLGKADVSGS